MKRLLASATLALLVAAPASAQQQDARWLLHLNGGAGFGFNWAGTTAGDFDNTYRDLGGDVSFDANGYLYDPRLVTYSAVFSWNRFTSGLDQGSSTSQGWNVNAGLSFFSERSFPFTIFYSRSSLNAESDL